MHALCRCISNTSIPSSSPPSRWPTSHALILAGAGSGKTRVLTTRIAWLIQDGHVTPGGVLAVTFTNKAAREMLTRLTAMLPCSPRGMWIGTFHGLANRLLRAHHAMPACRASSRSSTTQDQLSAVKRCRKSLNVDEDRFPPRELQRFINAQKEEGLRARDVPRGDDLTRAGASSSPPTTSSASAKGGRTSRSFCCEL
jgi:DNA helicase-2/ATP-dependent DNA helicase PcrA